MNENALLPTPTKSIMRAPEWYATVFLAAHHGKTQAQYNQCLRVFFPWCAQLDLHPVCADRMTIDAYKHYLMGRYKPASVNLHMSALKGFFKRWFVEGVITRDPAAHLTIMRVAKKSAALGVTLEEVLALLGAAQRLENPVFALRAQVIIKVLFTTGIRVSELTGARVEDVAFEGGYRVLRVTRKGGERDQVVLTDDVAALVDAYLACTGGGKTGPLLLTDRGNELSRMDVARIINGLRKVALPDRVGRLSPHDFRHGFVTIALGEGVDWRTVQHAAGHQHMETTMRYDRTIHGLKNSPAHLLSGLLSA